MDQHDASSPPQQQLPPALQLHILSFLPPNDRALSGRLVSRDAAATLTGPDHCTASLSQPLPPHAVQWAQAECWQQHVWQLSLTDKLHMPYTAATSRSEANLEVAWALLQPSIFPEMLQRCCPTSQQYSCKVGFDPGAAAAEAGHPELLIWLLRRCPVLLIPAAVLTAAALHCDLAGLQLAWRLLQQGFGSRCPVLGQGWLDAVAESSTFDAVAKMQWVLSAGKGTCSLQQSTAAAAARSGDRCSCSDTVWNGGGAPVLAAVAWDGNGGGPGGAAAGVGPTRTKPSVLCHGQASVAGRLHVYPQGLHKGSMGRGPGHGTVPGVRGGGADGSHRPWRAD